MHRIDSPSATPDEMFTDGSPSGGVPATTVTADWLNDLQENICALITATGLTLTKGRAFDLLDAVRLLLVKAELSSDSGWLEFGNSTIFQWGVVTASNGAGVWTYPVPFPETVFRVFVSQDAVVATVYAVGANPQPGNETIRADVRSGLTSGSDSFFAFAIGK